MKTVGLIGGVGPESTVDYYQKIIVGYRSQRPDGTYPSILINSVDVSRLLAMMAVNDLSGVIEYLTKEIERLAKAGADFGAISANTPHIVFDELQNRSAIPLVSMVEATCDTAKALGFERVGLFGTRYTMQGTFYSDVLQQAGLTLCVPSSDEQDWLHGIYVNELINGNFLPETRDRLVAIANRMKTEDSIEGLILGGTELPLILSDQDLTELALLDTTQIHVDRIVAELLR